MNIQFRLQNSIVTFNVKEDETRSKKLKIQVRNDDEKQPAKYSHLSKISLGKKTHLLPPLCNAARIIFWKKLLSETQVQGLLFQLQTSVGVWATRKLTCQLSCMSSWNNIIDLKMFPFWSHHPWFSVFQNAHLDYM